MLHYLIMHFAAPEACKSNFFGLPVWYQYLPNTRFQGCNIVDFQIADIPLIALAAVDIALRIAALVAVGYVIYGGVQFVIAQGESDKTKKARQTIIDALVGLVIAMLAAGIVAFIGTRFGS